MRSAFIMLLATFLLAATFTPTSAQPQTQPAKPAQKKKRPAPPFKWVNPLPAAKTPEGVQHHTFVSPSMKVKVGYCIYLPPQYAASKNSQQRFPVVY